MAKVDTKELLDIGDRLADQRAEIVEKQAANRELLRNLSAMDLLSESEEERLGTIYPVRERRSTEEQFEEGEE